MSGKIVVLQRESMADAWLGMFGKKPEFWECPCGCQTAFAYARIDRTVWLQPCFVLEEGDEDGAMHSSIFGIETERQLAGFVAITNLPAIRSLAAVLRPLIPGRRGADA